jgi:hypothetical protein
MTEAEKTRANYAGMVCGGIDDARGLLRDVARYIPEAGLAAHLERLIAVETELGSIESAMSEDACGDEA